MSSSMNRLFFTAAAASHGVLGLHLNSDGIELVDMSKVPNREVIKHEMKNKNPKELLQFIQKNMIAVAPTLKQIFKFCTQNFDMNLFFVIQNFKSQSKLSITLNQTPTGMLKFNPDAFCSCA